MARFLTLLVLLLAIDRAFACKPEQHFNANFSDTADQLSGTEAGNLATWVKSLQNDYSNHDLFVISSYVKSSSQPEDSAARRTKWLKDFLVAAGEDENSIVSAGTQVYKPENFFYTKITPSTLIIEFVPGCPNPCCLGANPVKEK